jgi:hypothetical protein
MKNEDLIRRIIRNSIKTNKTFSFSSNLTNTEILNCDLSATKFPVYYNSFEKLDCNDTALNSSLLKCIDTLLEWKLTRKLSFFYDIQLQPVFIFKNKLNCIPMYNSDKIKKYRCNLITKSLLNKKKIIWKLIFRIKNQICVPAVNMNIKSSTIQLSASTATAYNMAMHTLDKINSFNISIGNLTDQMKFILKKGE